jgi:adenylate kinase
MNIILLGPQGCGKGTQAELLAKNYNFFYFEAGGFLRTLAQSNKSIHDRISNGVLLEDNEMFGFVREYLEEKKVVNNIIFDGYPRSIVQYNLLEDWLIQNESKIDCVVVITLSEAESIRRLSARRMDPKTGKIYNLITNPPPDNIDQATLVQREDDYPDAIKTRLNKYHAVTEPLIAFLQEKVKVVEVNGEQPIEEIQQQIVAQLKNISLNQSYEKVNS